MSKVLNFLPLPGHSSLNLALTYDRITGELRWKSGVGGRAKDGAVAGNLNTAGHRMVKIKGRKYYAHRIAWKMVHGADPTEEIDHRNGIKDDNRLDNLREASKADNQHNSKVRRDNTSGFKGVSFNRQVGLFHASIMLHGKQRHLGLFLTPDQAHMARAAAACELHGEFAFSGVRNQSLKEE